MFTLKKWINEKITSLFQGNRPDPQLQVVLGVIKKTTTQKAAAAYKIQFFVLWTQKEIKLK